MKAVGVLDVERIHKMDHRDAAALKGKWYDIFNEKKMIAIFNGEEVECEFVVCSTCRGKGSYVNPSIDAHGISAEEFHEDPDFARDYVNGLYNITCVSCMGMRVVPYPVNEDDIKKVEAWEKEEQMYIAMCESERRMGA